MALAQINWLLSYIPEVAFPRAKSPVLSTPGAPLRSSVTEGMYQVGRLAGLSGAVAVAIGAYGAHGGMVMFCGPCYHYSLTGQEFTRRFTPVGGILFILGWLTFMF
ncbi:hypothetical protein TELCIR_02497 [Teladorsagia circumcincta]|uniref:Uncharacterized protein n=1 Tax=Teladorsagia circumcincta TaxID=45464 RepID=A0A2G9UYW5_TELCI|nr:hypothetical protein TELCIR_02497 [Teladorsagia circumcincta]